MAPRVWLPSTVAGRRVSPPPWHAPDGPPRPLPVRPVRPPNAAVCGRSRWAREEWRGLCRRVWAQDPVGGLGMWPAGERPACEQPGKGGVSGTAVGGVGRWGGVTSNEYRGGTRMSTGGSAAFLKCLCNIFLVSDVPPTARTPTLPTHLLAQRVQCLPIGPVTQPIVERPLRRLGAPWLRPALRVPHAVRELWDARQCPNRD